jgi:hypothetical protein
VIPPIRRQEQWEKLLTVVRVAKLAWMFSLNFDKKTEVFAQDPRCTFFSLCLNNSIFSADTPVEVQMCRSEYVQVRSSTVVIRLSEETPWNFRS